MPHVMVKPYPGRTESQKQELADEIAKAVVRIARCEESSVSVAFEEVDPKDWAETVYRPDILNARGKIYKQPGYDAFKREEGP